MLTIIEALVAEHRQFCAIFDHIERALPSAKSVAEIHVLARQVDGLLRKHAAAEEDLVLMVLETATAHKRRCQRFYAEHQEIDTRLTEVFKVEDAGRAGALLQKAIRNSRRHFKHEEKVVFPLIEEVTGKETLARWGAIWEHRRESLLGSAERPLSDTLTPAPC